MIWLDGGVPASARPRRPVAAAATQLMHTTISPTAPSRRRRSSAASATAARPTSADGAVARRLPLTARQRGARHRRVRLQDGAWTQRRARARDDGRSALSGNGGRPAAARAGGDRRGSRARSTRRACASRSRDAGGTCTRPCAWTRHPFGRVDARPRRRQRRGALDRAHERQRGRGAPSPLRRPTARSLPRHDLGSAAARLAGPRIATARLLCSLTAPHAVALARRAPRVETSDAPARPPTAAFGAATRLLPSSPGGRADAARASDAARGGSAYTSALAATRRRSPRCAPRRLLNRVATWSTGARRSRC